MAQGWAGFSEEELRRLKQSKDPFEPQRCLPAKKGRQQLQRERALHTQSQGLGLQHGAAAAPPEQLPPAPKQSFRHQPSSPPSPAPPSTLVFPPGTRDGKPQGLESQDPDLGPTNSHEGPRNAEVHPSKPDCTLETKKVELQERSRWEVLQQEQKLMEEKNKRKKALLAKAIAERSRRTQAETLKLKRIQKELQALDDMVSADIGILRNRIDQASLDYSNARKRFDKAEAEYVVAKLDLQRKTETKEQLTEHLCAIIQQNELRKAKKLEELMAQLEVQADDETLEPEVERVALCEQEVDARRLSGLPGRPPPGASGTLGEGPREPRGQAACSQRDGQGECPNSISLPDPQHQAKTATNALPASLPT